MDISDIREVIGTIIIVRHQSSSLLKIFGNQMIMVIISLVRERNGGRGSFAATLLNPNVENEGHSHTGPRYFETISGSG